MKGHIGILLGILFLLAGCTKISDPGFQVLAASHTGITFNNSLISSEDLNILTYLYFYNGGGVAAADYNNDGLVDLYFTGNQVADKLYLNKGGFQFNDITVEAGIINTGTWSTGVSHADINGDGLIDIYVCIASGFHSLKGHNLLYINKGIDENGIPKFKEESKAFGLDFSGLSTQAAFFDHDLDGDLDLYLMNHSVHPNRAYGRGIQREQFDSASGDRLFRNDSGVFTDISAASGIYQSKIGYGLGLAISDINNDNYPDIYVGNDFFENDYLYINQKNGSYKEIISSDPSLLGHTTHFSMGNDIADINNDGLSDILSVDMLPYNLQTYKAAGLEYSYPIYAGYLSNGYAPQFMQNTLHLNLGNTTFSEIAHMSGVSATDWSWSPLLADLDNDGLRDIYITNGIKGATNDMDFISFISNQEIQKNIDKGLQEKDLALLSKLPPIKVPNHIYKNLGDLTFADQTAEWTVSTDTFSNGATYADLDNDGDLDLVVNNIDDTAHVIENKLDTTNNYLKIRFDGSKDNRFGIGAKVSVYCKGLTQYAENYTSRGYLSATPPVMHFGLGENEIIDSLMVVWPRDSRFQTVYNVHVNQVLTLTEMDAGEQCINTAQLPRKTDLKGIDFTHKEGIAIEFSRNTLIPYASTNEGPQMSVSDINKDGLTDVFIGGAKFQPSELFIQDSSGNFKTVQNEVFKSDMRSEDVSQIFFDANGDPWPDLIVVSGGNEFKEGVPLQPRLYINRLGTFEKDTTAFRDLSINASVVKASDMDQDGDMDISIGANVVPWEFGATPHQYLFENDGQGKFTEVTNKWSAHFKSTGNVKDIVWADLNGDSIPDMVTAGHWTPISIYLNNGKQLEYQENNGLDHSHGWWNNIQVLDVDKDGDLDLIAGNFGENSKLRASKEKPINLYRYDFDSNGSTETLVTHYHSGQETAFASKDELVSQMPYLNKEYLSYQKYARANLNDLFGADKLNKADQKKVYVLASCWFENNGLGHFTMHKLPGLAQASAIQDMLVFDHNNDTYPDIFLIGNNYEISTQLGRMDALHGLILRNKKNGEFEWVTEPDLSVSGPARSLVQFPWKGKNILGIGRNNTTPLFLELKTHNE